MNKMIYIPKQDVNLLPEIKKAADNATPGRLGLGAYFVQLYKQEQARKDDGK